METFWTNSFIKNLFCSSRAYSSRVNSTEYLNPSVDSLCFVRLYPWLNKLFACCHSLKNHNEFISNLLKWIDWQRFVCFFIHQTCPPFTSSTASFDFEYFKNTVCLVCLRRVESLTKQSGYFQNIFVLLIRVFFIISS